MWKRPILAVLLVSIIAPAIAANQGGGQGRGASSSAGKEKEKDKEKGKGGGADAKPHENAIFNKADHDTFRNYFRSHKITAQALPPGIAKNLGRGKPLPPGIAKRDLPNDLVQKLGSRAQPGVSYAIAGDRVVAMKSGLVIDVIEGLFR
jgi:hypothetical protein